MAERSVNIKLNVTGTSPAQLKALAEGFSSISEAVNVVSDTIFQLKRKFGSLKAPKAISQVANDLKKLSKINSGNLSKITDDLSSLQKVKVDPSSIQNLINSLTSLKGIKIPSLKNFVSSLEAISKIDISKTSTNIVSLSTSLDSLSNRKFPSVTTLVSGLKKLISLDLAGVINKIKDLDSAIRLLDKAGYLKSFASFANNLNKIASSLEKTKKSLDGYKVSVAQAAKSTKSFGDRIQAYFEYRVVADAIMAIKSAVYGTIDAVKLYDQSLKDLQAITGATALEVTQMGEKIKEVAGTTKFSAQEVADGMKTLGQAGFSAAEAVETMQAVSDLATGTLSTMGSTVDLVTTAMRVFNFQASESGKVADVFANAVNKSKLTIDKLRTSFNYVGPIAKDAGISFEEVSASMMTLANTGLRASTIGTGLRNVFSLLVKPSEKLRNAVKDAGLSMGDIDPQTRSLKEVIQNLGLVVNSTGTAFDIFGKRGAGAVLALSKSGGQYESLLQTVRDSGTAARMASTQMEGLGVSFKNLKDKFGLLAISIGNLGIADAMRIIVDVGRKVIDVITALTDTALVQFIGKMTLTIVAVNGLVTAFTAIKSLNLLATISGFISGIQSATTALIASEASVSSLALTLGPIVAVLGLIAAGAIYAFSSLGHAKEASEEAAKLADRYRSLSNYIQDYKVKAANMKEGSDELLSSNKELRIKLLEVASGISDVSNEAERAAASIDPLTGEILDGGEALKKYNAELKKLTLQKLIESTNEAGKNITAVSGRMNQFLNWFKDAAAQASTAISGLGAKAGAVMDGEFEKGNKLLEKSQKDIEKYTANIIKAMNFSKALRKGEVDFKAFGEFVNSLDMSNLTSQQKDLVESFNILNDSANKLSEELKEQGKIDLNDTIENIEKIAKSYGIVGNELQATVAKLAVMKKLHEESSKSIIEKWGNDAKDTTESTEELITSFEKAGGKISVEQKEQMKLSEDAKKKLIDELNTAKKVRNAKINAKMDEREAYKEFFAVVRKLEKEAEEVKKGDASNTAAQTIKELQIAEKAYTDHVNELEAKYKGKAELLEKYLSEAERDFQEKQKSLLQQSTDPAVLLANTKVQIKIIEEEYSKFYKEIELASLKEHANKKALNEKRRDLELELSEKIKSIWESVEDSIEEKNSATARTVLKNRLDAEIKNSKLVAKIAQQSAKETTDAQIAVYEEANNKRAVEQESTLSKIATAETNGVLTHEEAEAAKLQVSLKYYEQAYIAAKDYLAQVNKGQNPDEYEKRQENLLSAEKAYYAKRKSFAEKFNSEMASIAKSLEKKDAARKSSVESNLEKIHRLENKFAEDNSKIHSDYVDKREKKDRKYAETVEKIELGLSDKIEDINEKLVSDLDKLNKKRTENAANLQAALLGIENDTEDKIRKINQRGMSESEKDLDNEKAAREKLAKAKELQQEAEASGNQELAKQAEDMIGQVQDLAENLKDAKDAKELLYDSKDALKDNAAIQNTIDNLALEKKEIEAIAEVEKKRLEAKNDAEKALTAADKAHERDLADIEEWQTKKLAATELAFNKAISLEDARHQKAMTNLDKEIAKLNERMGSVKELSSVTESSSIQSNAKEDQKRTSSSNVEENLKSVTTVADTALEKLGIVDEKAKQVANDSTSKFTSSMQEMTQNAVDELEQFIVITTATGEKVITTANTMSTGFSAFGDVVKTEPLAAIEKLKENTISINGKEISIPVNSSEILEASDTVEKIKNSSSSEMDITVNTNDALENIDEVQKEATTEISIPVQVDTEGVDTSIEKINSAITDMENPSITVVVDREELDSLISSVQLLSELETVVVTSSVVGADNVQELLTWILTLNGETPKNVKVITDVSGLDDTVKLNQLIDSLINKTVKVITEVLGLSDVLKLKASIDSLKDKTVTVTTIKKTVEKKAGGGEVGFFAEGGSVFRRLTKRFISAGSGLRDDVPAMLMKGEFVHTVDAVRKYGRNFMEMVNNGSFPVSLAKQAVPAFKEGGSVDFSLTSSGIAQQFAKGGSVLSGTISALKKRLYDLFSIQDGTQREVSVGSVNFANTVANSAQNISTELGQESISKLTEAFSSTVQAYASGGAVLNSGQLEEAIGSISGTYDSLIKSASNAGSPERAKLLREEQQAITEIADALRKKLAELKEEYDASVNEAKKSHEDTVSDAKESYTESVENRQEQNEDSTEAINSEYESGKNSENEAYANQVTEDSEEYEDSESEYLANIATLKGEYEESVNSINQEYPGKEKELQANLFAARTSAREAAKEVNEFGKEYGVKTTGNATYNTQKQEWTDPSESRTYFPEGWEIPDYKQLMSSIEFYWINSPIPEDRKAEKLANSQELASQKWEKWLVAANSLEDLGVSNIGPVMSGKQDLEKFAKSIITKERKKALADEKSTYQQKQNAYSSDWAEYKGEFKKSTVSRDKEHDQVLFNVEDTRNTSLGDEKESFQNDLASYLESFTEAKKAADETLNDTLLSLLQAYNDSVSSEKQSADEAISTKKSETQAALEELKNSLASGKTVGEALDNTAELDSEINQRTSIEELLRRLKNGIFGFNVGGSVPHTPYSVPGKDSLLAALTPGEYVIQEPIVRKFGKGFFEAINNFKIPKFNLGGSVGSGLMSALSNFSIPEFNLGGVVGTLSQDQASVKHTYALDLTINGKQQESVLGTASGIESIIEELQFAKRGA